MLLYGTWQLACSYIEYSHGSFLAKYALGVKSTVLKRFFTTRETARLPPGQEQLKEPYVFEC